MLLSNRFQNGQKMQTANEKIAAKTGVVQELLDEYDPLIDDSMFFQLALIARGYLIVEL